MYVREEGIGNSTCDPITVTFTVTITVTITIFGDSTRVILDPYALHTLHTTVSSSITLTRRHAMGGHHVIPETLHTLQTKVSPSTTHLSLLLLPYPLMLQVATTLQQRACKSLREICM